MYMHVWEEGLPMSIRLYRVFPFPRLFFHLPTLLDTTDRFLLLPLFHLTSFGSSPALHSFARLLFDFSCFRFSDDYLFSPLQCDLLLPRLALLAHSLSSSRQSRSRW